MNKIGPVINKNHGHGTTCGPGPFTAHDHKISSQQGPAFSDDFIVAKPEEIIGYNQVIKTNLSIRLIAWGPRTVYPPHQDLSMSSHITSRSHTITWI